MHKKIEGYVFNYDDKNHNNKYDEGIDKNNGRYISLKLFMSTDGVWLMETAKMMEPRVGDNTLAIFLEVPDADILSDAVMLCVGGRNAAQYLNEPKIAEFYGRYSTISKETVTSLIENVGNKDAFIGALRGSVSLLGAIVSWLPEKAGTLFTGIADLLERLKIAESTWNKDRVTPLLEHLDTFNNDTAKLFAELIGKQNIEVLGVQVEIPPNIKAVLKEVAAVISGFIQTIQGVIQAAGKVLEFVFALVCGVLNGIIDLIAGVISFVGMILKLIGGAVKGAAETTGNIDYYLPLLLEYADNFIQAVKKIDWGKVFKTIKDWLGKIISSIDLKKLAENAHISGREVGYYIGYIGINILACFVGVGEIAAITKVNKLAKPLQAIIEVISNTLGKLPAGARVTVETLFSILRSYIKILIKGTKSIIELINKIFEAVLGWIVSLMRGAYLVTLASGRVVTAQLIPGAELIIKLGMQAATILVRNNLNRLSLKVLFYEGRYFVKYGDEILFTGERDATKNFLSETLDQEETEAKLWLERLAGNFKKYYELRARYLKLGRNELINLWEKQIALKGLKRSRLKGFYESYIKQYPKLENSNFAEFRTQIYERGRVIDEVFEKAHSGRKRLSDDFLESVEDEKFLQQLFDYAEPKKRSRRNDSEIKFIYNFFKKHAHRGDYFIIETTNIFIACDSCKRELIVLKEMFGDKIKIVVHANPDIRTNEDLSHYLKTK